MSSNLILHGDARQLGQHIDRPINAIVTDPPFGVSFISNFAATQDGRKFTRAVEADTSLDGATLLFSEVMEPLLPMCADECELYVFTAWKVLDVWMPLVRQIPDFELKQMLIWEKGYPGLGDLTGNWGCGHEIILYLKKGRRQVPYRRSGVLHVDKMAAKKNIHPTEKPVQLLEILIEMSTSKGDFIVDPFSGSGSTSVAARNLGRDSLAFEVDEAYANAGRERLATPSLFEKID